MEWFRASLLVLTLSLGLVTGFYLFTARFWVFAAGRRLAALLSSFTALCLYVFIARVLPEPPRYALGTLLVLILSGAILRMGATMFADWRGAGAPAPRPKKKESPK
ncbi:membrane protein [Arthrobacter phage Altadena]|uniref:Membrane protein n=1 Tax=Arthrobacter phage Altadena TaxID=3059064 RepID=A0AA96KK07_9CAUD|nr:membrane protein [Arthrobacter phage Altadena]